MTNFVTRIARAFMPRFSCELKSAVSCREVEERIRGSLRTGFLRNRIKHPFTGTVGATEFKVGIDSWREDSPTYLRGHIEEVDGETCIRVIAEPGIFDMIGTLTFGVIACTSVVYFFALEMPVSVALPLAGGPILAVLIRKFTLQRFWEELDDALVNLSSILDASVASRTHDRCGAPIPDANHKLAK